jgi:deazaflavin-dependent oxidoreductase (nitroreductase family)
MTNTEPRGEWDWARRQAELFERTDGQRGNTFKGAPIVIMTTTGAKSGLERKTAVLRIEHDGRYAVFASKGGAEKNPTWYHNLLAHPEVRLQDGAATGSYRARELEGEERATWWARGLEVWPSFTEYQASTDRVIPVFLLTPAP